MASPLPAPVSRLRARRGFALLITITLLAFLVILLVGLATYTRIETAIAGNTQRQTQARQNALYAVNLAVAQLQKHAGPDNRVTATAAAVTGADPQKVRYTGVWDTRAAAGTAPVWLASGLETGTSPDVTTAVTNGIALVGTNTDGSSTANNVVAALQNLTAPGVPGQTGNGTVIGKYAWWVGDNGVKADVARTDVTAQLDYPPFITGATESVAAASDTEMRTRLFQQTGQGAGAFDTASNTAAFEPRDTANQALAANTLAPQQLPFLKNSGGTALGLTALKSHYHTWTVGNHAVLARTKFNSGETSLRTDLSLNPAALGTAFTAWANYPDYMETPAVNALRRRYKLTPAVSDANGSQFSVAPVLSYFAIAFSFRNAVTRNSGATATNNYLECGMHCVVSLWNPYTGALVPEDLEVVVTGLPKVLVTDLASTNVPVDLQTALSDTSVTGAPLVRLSLPAPTALPTDPQPASWLPGRVHSWSVKSGTVPTGGGVLPMEFGVRDLKGEVTLQADPTPFSTTPPFGSPAVTAVTRQCFLDTRTTLTIELRRSDGTTLARFESPAFRSFPSGSVAVDVESHALDFAFVFRLGDPTLDGLAWLQTTGLDVRNPALGSGSITPFVFAQNSEDPTQVVLDTAGKNVLTFATGNASLLLDRDPGTPAFPTGVDFNEDVPVFELPRSPLLSVAQLQHLSLPAQRPFWVGQSAASAGPAAWNNSLFDQYFFSGLGPGSTWTDLTRPLPNTLARVLRRKPDGTAVAVNDFAAAGTVLSTPPPPADPNDPVLPPVLAAGLSAKYLLQGGAFNLNSTEPDAWAAVLRSVRFPAGREFQYLDADPATGTNADTAVATLSAEAAFPRFSFSAQETYKTTPGYLHTDTGTTNSFTVHTEYYRQGLRTLDAATVTALAQNIAAAVKTRIAAKGPFLSVEEFLQPVVTTVVVPDTSDATGVATITTTTTGPSLLEQAIVDLKLNLDPNDPAGGNLPFSSSFLTQADLLTALAPVLFVRSDTFTIRAYGEATNPVTLLSEGKAWCEAVVQRLPEPFAPATSGQPTDDEYKTPPGSYGRRFKIVSFRWLTKSDI